MQQGNGTRAYYPTAADYINKAPYEALVPAHTIPQSPYITSGLFEPVWEPDFPEQMVMSTITIDRMVDFAESRVDFIISHDIDVCDVLHRIDRYFESMEVSIADQDQKVIEYANRLLKLRTLIYESLFLKVINRNPAFREAYRGSQPDIIRFLAMCPAFKLAKKSTLMDPIEAMRYPPIDIPKSRVGKKTDARDTQVLMSEEEKIVQSHTRGDPMADFSL